MERNDNFGSTGAGQQGGTPSQAGSQGSQGFGASTGTTGTAGASGSAASTGTGGATGSTGGMGSSASTGGSFGGSDAMPGDRQGGVAGVAHHLADKATDAASHGKDALGDRLGAMKEKAGDLKTTLADKLEQGAEALRNRTQAAAGTGGQQFAGAGAAAGLLNNERVQGYSNTLAGGLQGAADMLRDGDLQGALEKQVRENPARTLLIALGLGYVIGKAVRK